MSERVSGGAMRASRMQPAPAAPYIHTAGKDMRARRTPAHLGSERRAPT